MDMKHGQKPHQQLYVRIVEIRWHNKVTKTEVLERANTASIEAMLPKHYFLRMVDHRPPKQIMYGELARGKRGQGRPQTRVKDNLKRNLQRAGI